MGASRTKKLWISTSALALLVAASVAVFGTTAGIGSNAQPGSIKKTYKIVLSNNFVGNQWRVEMQNIAKAMATSNAPYKGNVDFKVVTSDVSPTSQIASLNDIIATGPDAILIDGASPTALNPVVKKACSKGIVVVSFDQTVTEPCTYRLHEDSVPQFTSNIVWLLKTMGGKGNLVQDLGLPGQPLTQISNTAVKNTLKKYPNVKVVASYEGDFAPGPSQKAMSSILAANKKIDGVYTDAGADGVVQAFLQAHVKLVPMVNTGDASVRMIQLVNKYKMQFQFALLPPTFSGYALQVAWRVLHKQSPIDSKWGMHKGTDPRDIILPLIAYNTNGLKAVPGVQVLPFSQLLSAAKGLSADTQLPYSIAQSPVTKQQVFGK